MFDVFLTVHHSIGFPYVSCIRNILSSYTLNSIFIKENIECDKLMHFSDTMNYLVGRFSKILSIHMVSHPNDTHFLNFFWLLFQIRNNFRRSYNILVDILFLYRKLKSVGFFKCQYIF